MIFNKSKQKTLVNKAILCKSFLSKMIGFMFNTKKETGLVFIFNMEKKLNFHTCFMFFALDFLFLDSKFRVIKIIKNVKPWRIGIKGKGMYVVELPAGKSSNTELKDKISFK